MKETERNGIGATIQQMVAGHYPGLTLMLTSMLLGGLVDCRGYQSEWEFLFKQGVPMQVIRGVVANVYRGWLFRPERLARLSAETQAEVDRFMGSDPETLSEDEFQTGFETLQRLVARDLRAA